MLVSATNRHHVNSLFTSVLGDHVPSLHLTAGKGLVGTGHALWCASQHLGTWQWVQAHPMAPHIVARQPNTPAGSAEGAGAETEFYLFGKHSNTMEMKAI